MQSLCSLRILHYGITDKLKPGVSPTGSVEFILPVPVFWCVLLASGPRAVSCCWRVRSSHPAEGTVSCCSVCARLPHLPSTESARLVSKWTSLVSCLKNPFFTEEENNYNK